MQQCVANWRRTNALAELTGAEMALASDDTMADAVLCSYAMPFSERYRA